MTLNRKNNNFYNFKYDLLTTMERYFILVHTIFPTIVLEDSSKVEFSTNAA